MSTLKADTVTTKSDNTDLTITGGGTGVPNLEAGFKVGGTAGVPVTELRTGTDGELITWDASGDPAVVAVGTATHILTSNGAGAAPTFQAAAAGGAWTLIGTVVASGQSTMDITGLDSTYDTYALGLSSLVPSDDGKDAQIRFGDASGFDSGGSDYQTMLIRYSQAGSPDIQGVDGSSIEWGNGVGSASGEGCGAMFFLPRPGDGPMRPVITGTYFYIKADGTYMGGVLTGERQAEITLDRVQFYFKESTVGSGRFSVWGISHA